MADVPRQKFEQTLHEFVGRLKAAFPEAALPLDAALARPVSVRRFVACLEPHSAAIRAQDPKMFDAPLFVLPGVDLSALWKQDMSETSRAAVWQYLQLLFVLARLASGSEAAALQDMIDSMRSPKKDEAPQKPKVAVAVTVEAEVPRAAEAAAAAAETPATGFFESLANDIAQELQLPAGLEECESPGQILQAMFSKEGGFTGMLQKVGDKVKARMETGELDEAALLGETKAMLGKMSGVLGQQQGGAQLSEMLDSLSAGGAPDMAKMMGVVQGMLGGQAGGAGNPLAAMLGGLSGLGGAGSSGGAANPLSALSGLLGGGGEEDMPDLEELQNRVRRQLRNDFRAQQAASQLAPRSGDARRRALRRRLEARRSATGEGA